VIFDFMIYDQFIGLWFVIVIYDLVIYDYWFVICDL